MKNFHKSHSNFEAFPIAALFPMNLLYCTTAGTNRFFRWILEQSASIDNIGNNQLQSLSLKEDEVHGVSSERESVCHDCLTSKASCIKQECFNLSARLLMGISGEQRHVWETTWSLVIPGPELPTTWTNFKLFWRIWEGQHKLLICYVIFFDFRHHLYWSEVRSVPILSILYAATYNRLLTRSTRNTFSMHIWEHLLSWALCFDPLSAPACRILKIAFLLSVTFALRESSIHARTVCSNAFSVFGCYLSSIALTARARMQPQLLTRALHTPCERKLKN